MFGTGKSNGVRSVDVDWRKLMGLLEATDQRAAVKQSFPDVGQESFMSALRRIDPSTASEVMTAGNAWQGATELVSYPVIAIAGMLNSGKTSLVSTFLSPQGRARTLRGVGNAQGTHRFVLWLPQRWRSDPSLWDLLQERLAETFGHAPEALADSPEKAHRQYSNRDGGKDSLSIPLVATDPALDTAGVGLLDCPDIVSDEILGLGSPGDRRKVLGRASTLCSAFLVVASAEQCRDVTLGELMRIAGDLMPGIPRMLAINKVRSREQLPHQVFQTFQPMMRHHHVEAIFAAYDFDVASNAPFIPRELHNSAAPPLENGEDLPIFFKLSERADQNPPNGITADRLLVSLPRKLDRGELFERFRAALESNVRTAIWDKGREQILQELSTQEERLRNARACMTKVGLDVFAQRGDGGGIERLRLHQNQRIVEQLTVTFANTAPWYARWSVGLSTKYRRVVGGAGDWFRKWLPTQALEDKAEALRGRLRRGDYGSLMTPEKLQTLIRQQAETHPLAHWEDNSPWSEACRTAIHRYDRDDFTALDPYELEEACRDMWSKVSWVEKGKLTSIPLLVLLTAFTAVLMLPLDMGATVLASASISELLAASGLTAAASIWAGGKTTSLVEQQAAKQQFVDLIAVLCDTFGIPRETKAPRIRIGKEDVKLPDPKIALRGPIGPTLAIRNWSDAFESDLRKMLDLPSNTPPR